MDENTGAIEVGAIDYTELTAGLVSAYVANNSVPAAELAALITATHTALTGLGNTGAPAIPAVEKLTPSRIRKSISHDALISFEDGKPYKTLKRHLTKLGLSPETYRDKWGLPQDYPMTAASYSEARSALAKSAGLGQQRRKTASIGSQAAANISETPKRASRPRKARQAAKV